MLNCHVDDRRSIDRPRSKSLRSVYRVDNDRIVGLICKFLLLISLILVRLALISPAEMAKLNARRGGLQFRIAHSQFTRSQR